MGYDTIIGEVFLFCALPVLVVGGVTILYLQVWRMENMTFHQIFLVLILVLAVAGVVVDIYLVKTKHKYHKKPYGRLGSLAALILLPIVLPRRFTLVLLDTRNFVVLLALIGVLVIFFILLEVIFFKGKITIQFVIALALLTSPLAAVLFAYTNTIFDFSEPQTSLATVVERQIRPGAANRAPRYYIIFSLEYPEGESRELRINMGRRFHASVREGDIVYFCIKPGLWGDEWNSCIHRILPDSSIHPDDDAPHLGGFP